MTDNVNIIVLEKEKKKELKKALCRVNSSVKYYEPEWISVRRTPNAEKVRVNDFKEFMESRVNYESCRIPELEEAVIKMEGRLFICDEIDGFDEKKHKFRQAYFSINEETQEELKEKVKSFLGGGSVIRFNSVETKIKIIIEE